MSNLLTIQDDVRDRIVATIADVHGVLMQSMTQSLSVVATKDAPASELRLRYWRYQRQTGAAEHAQLRDTFEDIVAREPNRATAWAALATLYCHETMFDYNTRPEALGRAKQAATRAIDLDAANQPAWEALAVACFFAHDRDGFVDAAERAMALNPRNTNTLAWMGLLFTHLGEYDRGLAIVERAMTLNPHFPRWYHFAHFVAHYEHGEYGEALRAARRINLPELLWSHWSVAIACGQPAARTRHAPPSTPFSSWRASLR